MPITAFVMVQVEGRRTGEVAQRMAEIEHVAEVYSVTGEWDLIAILRLPSYEQLGEVVPDKIAVLAGVRQTETTLAFRQWTPKDLDSAFDIGVS